MRFVYAGNRAFVLQRMLELGLDVVAVHAVPGSYLEAWLRDRSLAYRPIGRREEFVDALHESDFDVFVSCGCPVILPVGKLARGGDRRFVNLHPSMLPDLRGVDPVPGALLFGRPVGVTCHLMDDGIDTGPAIARIAVPCGDDVDVELLYPMTFDAEIRVFEAALARGFLADTSLPVPPTTTESAYYTFRESDAVIRRDDDLSQASRRLRAFSNRSKGTIARFSDGSSVRAFGGEAIRNAYLDLMFAACPNHTVVMVWTSAIMIKKPGGFLRLRLDPGTRNGPVVGSALLDP